MKKKEVKLFGIKIFEIVAYDEESEVPVAKPLFGKIKGEVLTYTPEQAQKDHDKEVINKMEGK